MEMKGARRRGLAMTAAIGVLFTLLGARYWDLQVVKGAHYHALAEQDVLRRLPIPAPRGNIVTADGVTVATSQPAWSLYYLDRSRPMPKGELDTLARYLGKNPAAIARFMAHQERITYSYDPVLVDPDLTRRQITAIEENLSALPQLRIQPTPQRYYPYGSIMGNILGYVQDISPQEYAALKRYGFSANSIVGVAGLEYEYNLYLHGHGGGEYAEINRQGQLVKLLGHSVPRPGDTLHLTINWRLEETAQKALALDMHTIQTTPVGGFRDPKADQGAVIAIDPNNGDILAMASLPTYNPERLVPGTRGEAAYAATHLMSGQDQMNLAISARFSPGSIFKPIVAVAALASGVVTPSTVIFDPGYFPKNPRFHNWYAPGFGDLTITQAIALSDDTFFYTLGYLLGIQRMDHWFDLFLLNHRTHIDLPGEARDLVPSPATLQATLGVPWTYGYNLLTAIGQGIDGFTLVNLARAESAIANGGTLYWPHLVSAITTPSGRVVKQFGPVVQGHVPAPAAVFHTVHQGMEMSAQDPEPKPGIAISGTGYGAMKGIPIPVATKTGTAQVYKKANNSFFITYAPMPHPRILVIVYVKGGIWGANAGFVARAIYDQYFKLQDPTAGQLFDSTFGVNTPWPFSYHPAPKLP
ncbi:MAG: penicillin-binding transpeptidase domain-containing protein [Firmicutes bacterium]|nr:penicillin-binding transpeptidase domain-containing protein [Bacillota bacterium]